MMEHGGSQRTLSCQLSLETFVPQKHPLRSLWEGNLWNPGTRYVMRRIPFARDAVMLSYSEARQLLIPAGFHIVRVDFFFPRWLRVLRPLERILRGVPLDAPYQILAQKQAG